MKWPKLVLPGKETDPRDTSLGVLNWLSITLLLFGIFIVTIFGTSLSGKATIFQWMIACLLSGTAIGFLFGIPKILQSNQLPPPGGTAPVYQQQVNTNLTEISDWLTKIIVGLGLVNLTKIPPYLAKIATVLAGGLSDPSKPPGALAIAFGYGVIVSYVVLGFLFGYITTRLYLAGAFSEADQRAIRQLQALTEEVAGTARSALQKAQFAVAASTPTTRVMSQQPEIDLEKLAEKYAEVRKSMPSGDLRTTKMTEVVQEMTELIPLVNGFDVETALSQTDIGKRLTGYIYLFVRPDDKYLPQLVDAFTTDTTPFGQYWGIQSLGKVLNTTGGRKLDSAVFEKIKAYYKTLQRGVDREYELSRIIPELKSYR